MYAAKQAGSGLRVYEAQQMRIDFPSS